MILVCDIGNSGIKTCFYSNDKISDVRSFENFEDFEKSISGKQFSDCVFSSVVPVKTELLLKLLKNYPGKSASRIDHNSDFNLKIDYKTPGTLGIDRICSAEGAYYLFNKSGHKSGNSDFIISIDFGTATTLNFVKPGGIFLGGMILPGIKMMFNSLSQETAQLPEVTEKDYSGLIGSDTNASIASGVINSQAGLIEKTIKEVQKEFDTKNIHIYITGGNAGKIIPHLKFEYEYTRELVLMGIIAVYKKNK